MITRASLALLLACLCAGIAPYAASGKHEAPPRTAFPGWPSTFEGRRLERLPLSPVELRFQENFPGQLARFSDGRREIILRWITEPSRKLHASGDCFKANGYAISPLPVVLSGAQRWSAFSATRAGQTLQVSEIIVDQAGGQWSDVSAWYWAAQLGKSHGPWWAVTVAHTQGGQGP
ncbi:MAG: hypothetical protein V4582_24500 [Pseudomonadota bacterium]